MWLGEFAKKFLIDFLSTFLAEFTEQMLVKCVIYF